MSAGKELKFQFILDESSFQRVKKAIQDLTSEMQKFAKAMQPAQGGGFGLLGGANVGRPGTAAATVTQAAGKSGLNPITQVVAANADAFKSLASAGTTSLKGLTDALKRSVNDQLREVRGLQQALDRLGATYNNLGGKGTTAMAVQNKMVQVAGRLQAARGQLGTLQGMLGPQPELMPEIPGPEGPQGRSRFSQWMYSPANAPGGKAQFFGGAIKGIGPTSATGVAAMGGIIVGGIMAAMHEAMAGTRMYSQAEARRGDLVAGEISRLRSGDITRMIARQDMRQAAERRGDLDAETGFLAKATTISGAGLSAAKNLIAMKGGASGTEDLTDPEAAMYANYQKKVEQYERSGDFINKRLALERFNSEFGARVSTGRILGAGLNRKIGPKMTGLGLVPGFGGMGLGTTAQDTYLMQEAGLHRQGYSMEQLAGAVQQSRQLGLGGAYAGEMMGAGAMGWGQWGAIRAAAARGGNANLALTALGATSNTAAGMEIGQTAFGFDPRGTTSGIGLMRAIQGGGFDFTGGVNDMNLAARIQLGMGAGDMMAQGFDPYQRGRNLVSAIGLGRGLGTYGQDYLGNGMSFKQLMDAAQGNITITGKAMGITSGMARQQLQNMAGSVFERYVDQGENTPMAHAIRSFRRSGKSLSAFLRTSDASTREAMGAFLGRETGQGEEAGLGAIGLLAGVGNTKLRSGKVPYGALGEVEKSRLGAEADQMIKDGQTMAEMFSQAKETFKQMGTEIEIQKKWASNLDETAEAFTNALHDLADTVNDTVKQIRTGQPAGPRSSTVKAEAAAAAESRLRNNGYIGQRTKSHPDWK